MSYMDVILRDPNPNQTPNGLLNKRDWDSKNKKNNYFISRRQIEAFHD